jgi:hypothetical protein
MREEEEVVGTTIEELVVGWHPCLQLVYVMVDVVKVVKVTTPLDVWLVVYVRGQTLKSVSLAQIVWKRERRTYGSSGEDGDLLSDCAGTCRIAWDNRLGSCGRDCGGVLSIVWWRSSMSSTSCGG